MPELIAPVDTVFTVVPSVVSMLLPLIEKLEPNRVDWVAAAFTVN
jgi:hypothetical protein